MARITKNAICDEVNGTLIHCPDCKTQKRMFHFDWTAIICYECDKAEGGREIPRGLWVLS